jgi:nicotinate phosphoribosyltransferase
VIKLSEQPIKISNPGHLAVRRFRRGGELVADVIYDTARGLTRPAALHDLDDPIRTTQIGADTALSDEDLLTRALDGGARVRPRGTIEGARARAAADLAALSPRTKRFLNPQPYPVGLDPAVQARKLALIAQARVR